MFRKTEMPGAKLNGFNLHYERAAGGPSMDYAAELRNMGAYISFNLRPYAAWVKSPTLGVHGTHDREVALEQGQELAGLIAGARLAILEGESHSLVIRSGKAQATVRQFIQEVERAN